MTTHKKPFYITTTLPYVNADLHLGHTTEFIRADIIARYKRMLGYDVYFNTGTDEHGQKIYEKALAENKDVQGYVDYYVERVKKTQREIGMSYTNFIRTTDEKHILAAQALWKRCDENGFIYKKNYKVKYCVGCELEKTDSELVDGECPDHIGRPLEIREEENYFFKFSALQEKLLAYYESTPDFVIPAFRFNEVKAFVTRGLEDFSISRIKEKMPWGVPVPGDESQVMYVWFDALTSYISTFGWPEEMELFERYWASGTPVQYCGKDNLRQQSAMWQGMLLAAGLPLSRHIIIDGFIMGSDGRKMSKTMGNVIAPSEVLEKYGLDFFRLYFGCLISLFEDTAVGDEMLLREYTAHCVNGVGNLVSRVMKLSEMYLETPIVISDFVYDEDYIQVMDGFLLDRAYVRIREMVIDADREMQFTEPFKVVKHDPEKGKEIIAALVEKVYRIARHLEPFMPETAENILQAVRENKKPENLFPRI